MDARVEGATPPFRGNSAGGRSAANGAVLGIIAATSVAHGINDTLQALIPALYPLLKSAFSLDYGQVGIIQLTFQFTASLLQPIVGLATDRRPQPYSLPLAMATTLIGLVLLATASSYPLLLVAAACVGIGSSIFHPEAARVARMASGGRHGFAQSMFQVGGNFGTAIGPLLAAFIVVPRGQGSVAWFTLLAFAGMVLLTQVGRWYARALRTPRAAKSSAAAVHTLPRGRVVGAILVLLALIFSKYFYLSSMNTFYTFYLIQKFGVSVQTAQVYLFIFLGAVAVGTIIGGPIGDRFGRLTVIWGSILAALPFTLVLPYVDLFWTCTLSIIIGVILASAFPAIIVYAQDLIPGKVGLVGGLFFGFAFGMGGLGAAVLGELADHTSITFVYHVCAFLPVIGILTIFLPNVERKRA